MGQMSVERAGAGGTCLGKANCFTAVTQGRVREALCFEELRVVS